MRHLVLWRRPTSEEAILGQVIVYALRAAGYDAVGETSEAWMPARIAQDASQVRQRMDWLCRGFGVVHAVGGRVISACVDAFGSKRPWIATSLRSAPPIPDLLARAPAACFPASGRHSLGRTILPPWEAETEVQGTSLSAEPEHRLVGLLTEGISGDAVYAAREAVRRVQRTLPNVKIALHGPGTAAMEDAETIGAGEGLTPSEFIASCHAMLFPQEDGPLRLDILRAMGMGLPVFVEEGHPATRWVHDGRNGIHYTQETLSDQLMSIMRDDYTREGMAHESRRVLAEEHDPTQQGRALGEFYQDVLETKS